MTIDGTSAAPSPAAQDTVDLTGPLAALASGTASGTGPSEAGLPADSTADLPVDSAAGAEPPQPVADTVWRYHLDVLIGESVGCQSWQGTDPVLGRKVGIRLLPADDDRADDLREAACLAARVSDRRLVHVLDVVDVRFDGRPHLAVVTEWVPSQPLTDLIAETLERDEALRICAEVAECLAAAHAEGIAHGRITPSSVLLTDNGDVRLRGLGTEAVLRGCAPDPDPARSDVQGTGALLYACVTGRWPYGGDAGLPAAPEMGGGIPVPSRVAPAVSAAIDAVCARSVAGCTPPRGMPEFATVAALGAALRGASAPPREGSVVAEPRRSRRAGRRLVSTVIGVCAVAALALMGWQLVTGAPAAFTPRPGARVEPAPAATPSASVATAGERPLAVIRVKDFDPLGNGSENPKRAPLAIDGKTGTAWTTVTYKDDYLSGKDGVGLLLDLGAPRPVSALRLSLLGKGTDVSILTAERPSDDPAEYRSFGSAVGAPAEITLRSPRPVNARYIVIWLTRVPQDTTGYQGGVSEVTVLG